MAIVSNATPLIAFAKIGQLSLLQKTVKNLVIPDAVRLANANTFQHQSVSNRVS
jgi:predicted nucleic acid-binding protein